MADFFRPAPESDFTRKFRETRMEATIQNRLLFLLDHFPQKKNNEVVYLIEGGAAMFLLNLGDRGNDIDIDIITTSQGLCQVLANTRIFDSKMCKTWLEFRGISHNLEIEQFIMRVLINQQ